MSSRSTTRRIAHVDMDAFYASVEIRDDPSLRGKPVVVGGAADRRGVVCAASYEARKYGIHSAMPMAEACRRCPGLVRIRVQIDRYVSASGIVMDVLKRFSPTIEPLSLDEAFLDLTGTERSLGPSLEVGRRIKREIRDATALTASVGIAPVKFVAKIASDLEKPDGLVVVDPGEVTRFLHGLPIEKLWGVGPKTRATLTRLGFRTIGDVAVADRRFLESHLGLHGAHLQDLAQGRDDRSVVAEQDAKSYSHEITFPVDQSDGERLRSVLLSHASRVARRLRKDGVRGRTIVLKLRDHTFETHTHRVSGQAFTDNALTIYRKGARLLEEIWDGRPIRLIGLGVSGIAPRDAGTQSLFGEPPQQERHRRLQETIDSIEERFGKGRLFRAGTMRGREAGDTGSSLNTDESAD